MKDRVRIAGKSVLYPIREGLPVGTDSADIVARRTVVGSVMLQTRRMTTSRNDFIARTNAILSYVPQRPH